MVPNNNRRRATAVGGIAAGVGAAALFSWLTSGEPAQAPDIIVADGPLKRLVLPHCSALLRPYKPTPWASNTHVQTCLGLLRKLTVANSYSRQLVQCEDGGTVALDWYAGCDALSFAPLSTPIMLICHGINGGSHEGYCKWACHQATSKGWRGVVLNYRGCNGLPLTSPRGYTATVTRDLHIAIESIKARFPAAPLFAVGYSLGGLVLTKYLGEAGCGLHGPTVFTRYMTAKQQGTAADTNATADGNTHTQRLPARDMHATHAHAPGQGHMGSSSSPATGPRRYRFLGDVTPIGQMASTIKAYSDMARDAQRGVVSDAQLQEHLYSEPAGLGGVEVAEEQECGGGRGSGGVASSAPATAGNDSNDSMYAHLNLAAGSSREPRSYGDDDDYDSAAVASVYGSRGGLRRQDTAAIAGVGAGVGQEAASEPIPPEGVAIAHGASPWMGLSQRGFTNDRSSSADCSPSTEADDATAGPAEVPLGRNRSGGGDLDNGRSSVHGGAGGGGGGPPSISGSGLAAAAVVSSPVCMWKSSANLSKPWSINLMYNLAVAHKLKEFIQHHESEIRGKTLLDVDSSLAAWTVQQVEDAGVSTTLGFPTRQHYYEAASSTDYIPHINTPTLILLAKDDPFLGMLPDLECQRNPHTLLAATQHGGHVAFLQGLWPFGPAYMDTAVLQFFDATLKHYPYQTHEDASSGNTNSSGDARCVHRSRL